MLRITHAVTGVLYISNSPTILDAASFYTCVRQSVDQVFKCHDTCKANWLLDNRQVEANSSAFAGGVRRAC
jgi:hypothetical protein